jgi:hypothetical protein
VGDQASGLPGIILYVNASQQLVIFTHNASASTNLNSNALTWTAGQTYRAKAVWGAGNLYLYRNDVLVANIVNGSAVMPTAHQSPMYIGSDLNAASSTFFADGWISNLRFYA